MPDQSEFSSFVNGALGGYQTVAQIKADKADQRRRDAALKMQKEREDLDLADRGYTRLTMPTIEPPPDPNQDFVHRIGSLISKPFRSTPEPGEVLMKVGPSVAETAAQAERDFTASQNALRIGAERDIARMREQGDTERTRMSGANSQAVARISAHPAEMAAVRAVEARKTEQRDALVDDAIAAADGDPTRAGQILATNNPRDMTRLGITSMHLEAGARRFRDRPAQLQREGYQSLNQRAAIRGGGMTQALQSALGADGGPAQSGNIDLGDTQLQQQRADWDAAAAYARSQGKNPAAVLPPRP